MGLLSTPRVSSVPGEYNYFSAGAKVIITAGASGYCMGKKATPPWRALLPNLNSSQYLYIIGSKHL